LLEADIGWEKEAGNRESLLTKKKPARVPVFILLSVQLWRIHPEMKCTSSILDDAYKINVKSWHVSCGTFYFPTFFSFWAGEA
jgi:hypothetical protein